ncbi:MAG: hypothetical protein MST10_02350 [Lentisphaeria bacterium]|nr:hypothetical protein [Lentisphaeria bacterium]
MKFSAALDLSGDEVCLALAREDGEFLLNINQPMHGRDSANLAKFVNSQLQAAQVDLADITHWTVGTGPGSFTGMRLAAALVGGLTFGNGTVKKRGVPGALALAGTLFDAAVTEKAALLFDGRNKELLVYEVSSYNGEFVPGGFAEALDGEALNRYFAANPTIKLGALAKDMTALEKLLTPEIFPRVTAAEHLDAGRLLRLKQEPFDNDLTKLVYIRPAVFHKKNAE